MSTSTWIMLGIYLFGIGGVSIFALRLCLKASSWNEG